MKRLASLTLVLITCAGIARAEGDFKVETVKDAPEGLSEAIAARLNAEGLRISGKDGVVCDIWLVKEVPVKPKFKSTGVINYPFASGELVGAIRFPEKPEASDFRGQMVPPGVYTLRYGQQPSDGNHLGTSDVNDFLVCCSAKEDKTPQRIEKSSDLFKLSGKSIGTTHPAVFQLPQPPSKPNAAAKVAFDDEREQLTVDFNLTGSAEGKTMSVPVTLVAIGHSEG